MDANDHSSALRAECDTSSVNGEVGALVELGGRKRKVSHALINEFFESVAKLKVLG